MGGLRCGPLTISTLPHSRRLLRRTLSMAPWLSSNANVPPESVRFRPRWPIIPRSRIQGPDRATVEDCVLLAPSFTDTVGVWYQADLTRTGQGWIVEAIRITTTGGCVPGKIADAAIAAYQSYYDGRGRSSGIRLIPAARCMMTCWPNLRRVSSSRCSDSMPLKAWPSGVSPGLTRR